jgi:hypothetical protein
LSFIVVSFSCCSLFHASAAPEWKSTNLLKMNRLGPGVHKRVRDNLAARDRLAQSPPGYFGLIPRVRSVHSPAGVWQHR